MLEGDFHRYARIYLRYPAPHVLRKNDNKALQLYNQL